MIVTWSIFTQYVEWYFANQHSQVNKFGAEFLEQFSNIATIGENYPVLFFVPINITIGENVQNFTFDVYCLDVIIKDRSNISSILSTTQSILTDLYNFLRFEQTYNYLDIDVITEANMTPINNYLLDYDAGWKMTLTIELPNSTECDIPFV